MGDDIGDIEDVSFDRPCTAALGASVPFYMVHVALCGGGNPVEWAKKVEKFYPLFAALKNYYKDHESEFVDMPVRLMVCNAPENPSDDHCDLLVFGAPREGKDAYMSIFRGIGFDDIAEFFEYLKSPKEDAGVFSIAPLTKPHVFICSHQAKDARCGYCGPRIAAVFKDAISKMSSVEAEVYETSHFGGHKFAANAITYPSGHWWGYVKPKDISRLLPILSRGMSGSFNPTEPPAGLLDIWRGRMGTTIEEQALITPHAAKMKDKKKKSGKDKKKKKKKKEGEKGEKGKKGPDSTTTSLVAPDAPAAPTLIKRKWRLNPILAIVFAALLAQVLLYCYRKLM